MTMISRVAFLEALTVVAQALASDKGSVKELSNVWFDGSHMFAYNGSIGIEVPFQSEFKGGVKGLELVKLLKLSWESEIEFKITKNDMVVTTDSGAEIKLKLSPIENAEEMWVSRVSDRPKIGTGYKVTEKFLAAVKRAMLSYTVAKVQQPEHRGLTLRYEDGWVDLYSTDGVSLTKRSIEVEDDFPKLKERIIVQAAFCDLLERVKPGAELSIHNGSIHCIASIDEAVEVVEPPVEEGDEEKAEAVTTVRNVKQIDDAYIQARLIDDVNHIDFDSFIEKYYKDVVYFKVPANLEPTIERASVVLTRGKPILIYIDKDKKDKYYLCIDALTGDTDATDQLPITVEKDPFKGDMHIDPKNFFRAIKGGGDELGLRDECAVFVGKDYTHIVSSK
jgi:hypothetical protein